MGNENGIGTRVSELCLYVQTNNPYYHPNSLVQGAVYVDVYSPIMVYNIELRLKGVERLKWEEAKNTDGNRITERKKDKQTIFAFNTTIHAVNAVFPIGQYQFPFAFQLPDRIPGTFNVNKFEYDGRIRYTLTALLNSERPEPIKYRSELIIRQRPTIANYNVPITNEADVCICCSRKGRTSMKCAFQSDTYQPGNDAILMVEVNNEICTADIVNFTVSLNQHLNFRTKSGKTDHFTRLIRSNEFPGLAKFASTQGNPQLMSLRLEESSSSGLMIQPSVDAAMTTCSYELEVKPVYEGTCASCSNTPVVSIPLYIYAPDLQGWISAPPPNFQPKIYDTLQIIIPMPSMRIEGVLGGNIAPPISANVNIGPPNVNQNINMNIGVPTGNINMNISGPNASVNPPMPHANIEVSATNMNISDPNVNIDIPVDMNISGPGGNLSMGAGGANVNMDMNVTGANIDMNVSGDMGVNMGMPGVNVNISGSNDI